MSTSETPIDGRIETKSERITSAQISAAEIVKLRDALFKSPFRAFRVMQQPMDEGDDYHEWDLEPLLGP